MKRLVYTKSSSKAIALYALYFLMIAGSTLSSSMFINYTQPGFYLCAIPTAGLAACLLLRSLIVVRRIYWNQTVAAFAVFLVFIYCHILRGNSYPDFFGGKAGIWTLSFVHLLILSALFGKADESPEKKKRVLFSLFLATAVFQSAYAYLQMAGLTGNISTHFTVGGTMGNPNVLAIFLSLVLAYALNELPEMKKRGIYPYLLIGSAVIILPVIVACQCRTAWLALLAGILSGVCIRCRIPALFKRKIMWLALPVIAGAIAFGGHELYRFKQASADGRLYIWKLTAQMISRKPLQGYGFNAFEKEYNLYQAGYFSRLPDDEKRYDRSLYAENAFNDFLENCMETGIPGMLLFLSIFVFAVKGYFRQSSAQRNRAAFGTLLAWIVVALFNYSQTVPFNMLFLSFILAAMAPGSASRAFPLNKALTLVAAIAVTGAGIRTGYACRAERELKRQLSTPDLSAISVLAGRMPQTGQNLYACAGICMKAKDREKADLYLQKARNASSSYNLYKSLGRSAALKSDYPQAIRYYSTALNMAPLLILPRYELFRIYRKTGMKAQADEQAQIIISIRPKTKNEKVEQIKEKMKEYRGCVKTSPLHPQIPAPHQHPQ